MKKLVFLFMTITVLTLTIHHTLTAQDGKVANKLFYTELGGPGVLMSASFDSRFVSNNRQGFGFRLGAGFGVGKVRTTWVDNQWNYTYTENLTRTYYSFPAGLNYVFGKPNSANTFEVGAGVTYLTRKVPLYCYEVKKPGNMIGFVTFMYRMMPVDGGFSFRIGCTPIIGTSGDLRMSGAIGFGYAF